MKVLNFTFYGGREHKTTIFFFFFELGYTPFEFNSRKSRQRLTNKRVGIRTMKFEAARIHFLRDVFAAVAVVLLKLAIFDKELSAVCSNV